MINNAMYSVGSHIAENGLDLSSRSYNIMLHALDSEHFF